MTFLCSSKTDLLVLQLTAEVDTSSLCNRLLPGAERVAVFPAVVVISGTMSLELCDTEKSARATV
mgnify:CR=1